MKRGWEGPSRCPLCTCHEENSTHLFLQCSFASDLWNILFAQLNLALPPSIAFLFDSWSDFAPFSFSRMKLLKHCWMWTPKILCWKLWLERNNRIFRGLAGTPAQVASKVKALLGELAASNANLTNEATPDREEYS